MVRKTAVIGKSRSHTGLSHSGEHCRRRYSGYGGGTGRIKGCARAIFQKIMGLV